MSAEILRRAAALMRERAEAATPGPWRDSSTEDGVRLSALVADAPHPDRPNAKTGGWAWDDAYGGCLVGESLMGPDRTYIAGMNPDVALAVADWLDGVANLERYHRADKNEVLAALTVARAYLGESA